MSTATSPVSAGSVARFRAWLAAHPVAGYLAMSFALGWSILIPAVVTGHDPSTLLPLVAVLAQLGPALLVRAAGGGRTAVLDLLRRLAPWRVHPGRPVLIAAGLPVACLLVATPFSGLRPWRAVVDHPGVLTAYGVQLLYVASTNLWEEAGWMASVQTRFEDRHSPLMAAVMTTPLFALIHIPAFVTEVPPVAIPVVFLTLLGASLPLRIVLGRLYHATGGSLFVVALFHTAVNAVPASGMLTSAVPHLAPVLLPILVTAVLAAVVLARTGSALSRPTDPADTF